MNRLYEDQEFYVSVQKAKILFILTVLLFIAFTSAYAHEGEAPPSSTPAADERMQACLQVGARAAWGAASRFAGAPYKFERTTEQNLKALFWAIDVANDVPAIFTLDFGEDYTAQREYEEAASYGWREADAWVKAGKERPDYETLLAIFYNGCKSEQ